MPAQLSFDKATSIANTLAKVSAATGITNFTKSSTVRAFTEATASDIDFFNKATNDLFSQYYIQFAAGEFLDLKGNELGIQRNISDFIYVNAGDEAIALTPNKTNQTFRQTYTTVPDLLDGTELGIFSNRIRVVTNSSQSFDLDDSQLFISATLIYTGSVQGSAARTVNFNAGDKLQVTVNNLPMTLEFLKPVAIEVSKESDADYRRRLLFAKASPVSGTTVAVGEIFKSVPMIAGYSITEDKLNNKTTISVLPTQYTQGVFTSAIAEYAKTVADKIMPYGSNVEVVYPSKIELYIEFSADPSNTVPDETIKSVIKTNLYNFYKYSDENLIDCQAIQDQVNAVLKTVSGLTILNISIYNGSLQKYLFKTENSVNLPKEYFAYITDAATQITRV